MNSLLKNIKKKKILVIGDLILDRYVSCDTQRISREAPIPVFLQKNERFVLGGACNAAANIVGAGQDVSVLGVIGNDHYADEMIKLFDESDIEYSLVTKISEKTTVKTRCVNKSGQQIFRLDFEQGEFIDPALLQDTISKYKSIVSSFDLVVISDYMEGLLSHDFTKNVIEIANTNNVPVLVDVRDVNYEKYKGAFLLKPNLTELRNISNMPVDTDEQVIEASHFLRNLCDADYVLSTCGPRGMVLVGKTDDQTYIKRSAAREVFDVTGAGDTSIAYLAACIANAFDIETAIDIANIAAGIQVEKNGTSVITLKEVEERVGTEDLPSGKLIEYKDIDRVLNTARDKKIVFTNGCFDILHAGHVKYLTEASREGDILIVGLNSDASVKRIKGNGRPINNQEDRALLLSALEMVDHVIIFDEDTPIRLIEKILPDILVKGGDYADHMEDVVGADVVKANGGIVKLMGLVEGRSTTGIMEKCRH